VTANRHQAAFLAAAAVMLSVFVPVAGVDAASPDEQRAETRKMADSTLERLYAAQPVARKVVHKAAGYAVFSEVRSKILVAGGGGGKGIVVDAAAHQDTFMRVATLQAGFGMGISKSHLVWVFEHERDLKDFINNGLVLGADVDLKVNPGTGGDLYAGAATIRPGVWLYQLSDQGLVADLTIEGTKYFKDPNLN
jgi:lipid-binding SYLF domain-containing protein